MYIHTYIYIYIYINIFTYLNKSICISDIENMLTIIYIISLDVHKQRVYPTMPSEPCKPRSARDCFAESHATFYGDCLPRRTAARVLMTGGIPIVVGTPHLNLPSGKPIQLLNMIMYSWFVLVFSIEDGVFPQLCLFTRFKNPSWLMIL